MPGGSQLDAWRCLEGDRSMPWGVSSGVLWFLSATPNACAGSGECACARVCEVWIVADCCCCCGPVCSVCSAALACDARVLCACACWMRVRVCVCCARAAGVCCVLYSVVRLFVQLGGAALPLAGRAARRDARRAVGGRAPAAVRRRLVFGVTSSLYASHTKHITSKCKKT